jgi:CBS domain-containing protein
LTERQEKIVQMVKEEGPLTSEQIADNLGIARATIRPDLSLLTLAGFLEARPKVGYFYSEKRVNAQFYEAVSKIKVKEVKSSPAVIRDSASVYDGIVTIFLEDTSSVIVVDQDNALTGIVSRKDFLRIAIGGIDIHKVPIGMIMTRMPNIITVSPEDSVYDAAKKMIEHQIDGLPVVQRMEIGGKGEKWKVVGKITKTNITRLFIELAE